MVTEDYVSFETAKLFNEKGFVLDNITMIIDSDNKPFLSGNCGYEYLLKLNSEVYPAPTLQMAMKWLREEHNLCLEPYRTACGYLCDVARVPSGSELYGQDEEGDDEASGQFTTYEKSCEAAIKYCLENLI